jgi:hypothetical protein
MAVTSTIYHCHSSINLRPLGSASEIKGLSANFVVDAPASPTFLQRPAVNESKAAARDAESAMQD